MRSARGPATPMSATAQIASSDRIPLLQKVMFSLGQNTDYVATGLMTTVMWMPYFNLGLGLSPVVLGVILMVLRAWDAITDPIMGNISDNARTRWGRRRPFMFVGAITTALLYPLIWHFPASVLDGTSSIGVVIDWIPFSASFGLTAVEKTMSVYLTIIGMIFFTSFTCWSMPYYGLQLELTPDYDERTRLTAVMAFFGKLTALVTGWTFVVIVYVGTVAQGDAAALAGKPEWVRNLGDFLRPMFSALAGDFAGEKPLVTGMKLMCWLIAVMIIVLGILPAIFVKERFYEKEAVAQAKEPFWRSVKDSLRCGPLWALISASFFLVMGYSAIGSLGQYVNIYHVCDGDMLKAGAIGGVRGMVIGISGIAMLPLFTWLGERFDKRNMVLSMLGMSMLGHASNYWLMTPDHPYWQIASGVFEASAVGAVWMFLPSMKADVADHDELSTHRRREGAINAFYSWFIKASLTASMGISGVVLAWTRFNRDLPKQPPEVISKMFHIYLWLPVAIWVLALVSIWFYPLTRARCAELRATLETRRGAL